MTASLHVPLGRRWRLFASVTGRLLELSRMLLPRDGDRHVRNLSPHQLRDIGLPEALSDRLHPYPIDRFLEKFK